MSDSGTPRPLAVALLLALVLTAWCLASNSLDAVHSRDSVAISEQ